MGTHIDLDLVTLLKYTLSTTRDERTAIGCWRQLRKIYRGPLYLIALPPHRTAESRDLLRHMVEAHRDDGASGATRTDRTLALVSGGKRSAPTAPSQRVPSVRI